MCKAASMVETRDKMYWSDKTDSHHKIIEEFGLCESGARGVNVVPIEITPPGGNLSLPLKKWEYAIDQMGVQRDLPEWFDRERSEQRARACLSDWAEHRLRGWKLKEAFNPINPLKRKQDKTLDKLKLLKKHASVSASVYSSVSDSVYSSVSASVSDSVYSSVSDSVYSSVYPSVEDSVEDSVSDSVYSSVSASVYAYIGSLFHNIKKWKYTDIKNPWRALRKLWLGGYVPSFDGKTWRLHAGLQAEIVFEISAEELRKK